MNFSKNEKVQSFLEEIRMIDFNKFEMLQDLRKIVFSNYKNVKERMMYGGIMFSLAEDFGGIFVRKNHISFEFGFGVNMNDADNFLEGKGKFRRHLKLRNSDDITDKKVDYFVKQVSELFSK